MASRPILENVVHNYGQWRIDDTAKIPCSTRKSMQKAKAVPSASDCNDSLEHLASYDRSECDVRAQPQTDHEEYSQADTEKSFGEKLYPGSQPNCHGKCFVASQPEYWAQLNIIYDVRHNRYYPSSHTQRGSMVSRLNTLTRCSSWKYRSVSRRAPALSSTRFVRTVNIFTRMKTWGHAR